MKTETNPAARANARKAERRYPVGSRVRVQVSGMTATVEDTGGTMSGDGMRVRVRWDERPYSFSPEVSTVSNPSLVFDRVEDDR